MVVKRRPAPPRGIIDDGKEKTRSEEEQVPLLWQKAAGDCAVMLLWVLAHSQFAEAAQALHMATGAFNEFFWSVTVTLAALAAMVPISDMLWGGIFNPVHPFALVVSGRGAIGDNALRMTAQLAGALGGMLAATYGLPLSVQSKFQHLPGGIRGGHPVLVGMACEGFLSFVINCVFLWSCDAKNKTLVFWTPLATTVVVSIVGSEVTGPSLNPYVNFSWNLQHQSHDWMEHMAVYWAAPFAGAAAAALLFRFTWPLATTSKSGSAAGRRRAAVQARRRVEELQMSTPKKLSASESRAPGTPTQATPRAQHDPDL